LVYFTRKANALYVLADQLKKGPLTFEVAGLPAHTQAELLGGLPGQVSSLGDRIVVKTDVPAGLTSFAIKVSGIRSA